MNVLARISCSWEFIVENYTEKQIEKILKMNNTEFLQFNKDVIEKYDITLLSKTNEDELNKKTFTGLDVLELHLKRSICRTSNWYKKFPAHILFLLHMRRVI